MRRCVQRTTALPRSFHFPKILQAMRTPATSIHACRIECTGIFYSRSSMFRVCLCRVCLFRVCLFRVCLFRVCLFHLIHTAGGVAQPDKLCSPLGESENGHAGLAPTSGVGAMGWQWVVNALSMCSQCDGIVLVMSWQYVGNVSAMCWERAGKVLCGNVEMWKCGNAVATCWPSQQIGREVK